MMENAGYLLAAYAIIWAVIFGYVFYMQRKQTNLRRQLDKLQKLITGEVTKEE
jgi:CcmD family protein